jgi:hypothetical protein
MKTIVRPSIWAFFYVGPGLALAGADRFFVALPRFADWTLGAPVQRPQDLPDMAFVVNDAELSGDQTSHSRTGPERRREAVGFGAFEQ